MMTATDDVMRVWVGCLACYNAGRLVGEWVDAVEAGEFVPCHRDGHEEWWCFDHEGLPITGECSPAEAQRWAEEMAACAEGTGAPLAAVKAYMDNFHGYTSCLDDFEDAWCGSHVSERDYAEELAEGCGYVPNGNDLAHNPLLGYIDWDAWTRDVFMDHWSAPDPDGGVFVFRNV